MKLREPHLRSTGVAERHQTWNQVNLSSHFGANLLSDFGKPPQLSEPIWG
jgi:hypothetical protein